MEEGVAAPGPPSSGSVEARRADGGPPPGDVGGEDDLEVTGLVELAAAAEATDESTEPAGLADRPPGLGTLPILGILFPIKPLVSDDLLSPPTIPAVFGSRVGKRFPTSPPREGECAGPAWPKG